MKPRCLIHKVYTPDLSPFRGPPSIATPNVQVKEKKVAKNTKYHKELQRKRNCQKQQAIKQKDRERKRRGNIKPKESKIGKAKQQTI